MPKVRFETFGGIISSEDPPFLAYVDREYMKEMGYTQSPLWSSPEESVGVLSAPTEVHFACTNRCSAGCSHCYMDSGSEMPGELNTEDFKKGLRALADMGVFHVALGGGEALQRDDLFELAEYASEAGLVPNLTTNGIHVTRENASGFSVFGQVNLSLDGVGPSSAVFRGTDNTETVKAAADILVSAGVPTGINCVLGRDNFDCLDRVFAFAAENGLNEVELLRYKPAGRGGKDYRKHSMTYEQNTALYPYLLELSEKNGITAKIDCSFVPMLCYHNPPYETLEKLCVLGCEAGNMLAAATSDGHVSGCSFLPACEETVFTISDAWNSLAEFDQYRTWDRNAPEPCASCEYVGICKGGCHAVSLHVYNNLLKPDPDCPRVAEYIKKEGISEGEENS